MLVWQPIWQQVMRYVLPVMTRHTYMVWAGGLVAQSQNLRSGGPTSMGRVEDWLYKREGGQLLLLKIPDASGSVAG